MCNRVIQKGRVVKPQGKLTVLLKGPGGEFELPLEAVFGGPARSESMNYWLKREHAEEVRVPDVQGFGEQDKTTGVQNWERVPERSSLQGLLLPQPEGKDYRLLKVVTQTATEEQRRRLGNDRAPVIYPPAVPEAGWHRPDESYLEFPPGNLAVWTTDGQAVRLGHWTAPEIGMPLMEGKWEDEAGQALEVTHWAFIEAGMYRAPEPPLPHPGFAYLREA